MKEVVTIAGKDIMAKTYQGKRVVTFWDIDFVHERPEGTANRNFHQNQERFIEGEDYIKITPDEICSYGFLKMFHELGSPTTLFTVTGYLMLVKSFTDDLSWRVERELVNSYFCTRELSNNDPMLMTMSQIEKLIIEISKGLEQLERLENLERGSKMNEKRNMSYDELREYLNEKEEPLYLLYEQLVRLSEIARGDLTVEQQIGISGAMYQIVRCMGL